MKKTFINSVSTKIISFLLISIVFIMIVLGYISYSSEKKEAIKDLIQNSIKISERISVSLVYPLWNIEEKLTEKTVILELANKNVKAIIVKTPDDQVYCGKIKNKKWEIIDYKLTKINQSDLKKSYYTKTINIEKNNELIGSVSIYITDFFLNKYLNNMINRILLQTILISLICIGIILLSLEKIILFPLKKIASKMRLVAKGDLTQKLDIKTKDEMGQIAETFNYMGKELDKHRKLLIEKERLEKEMEIAKMIQTSLLPDILHFKSEYYDMNATMIPAAQVGGDYYDLVKGKDEKTWFGIGDVTGHGLKSGLIMMMAQTAANALISSIPNLSPKDLIVKLNKTLTQNIRDRLKEEYHMTMTFLSSDNEGNFEYAGAHLDILIYRAETKTCEIMKTNGVWLGILPDIEKQTKEAKFQLNPGDCLILYTDGIIEATDLDEHFFNKEGLIEAIIKFYHQGVKGIVDGIIKNVFDFMNIQKDDITLFVAMRK